MVNIRTTNPFNSGAGANTRGARRFAAGLALFLAFAAPFAAHAEEAVGTMKTLRMQDASIWGPDSNFLLLNGITTASGCGTYEGLVLMRIKGDKAGDRQTAIALLAQATGKQVRVSVGEMGAEGKWKWGQRGNGVRAEFPTHLLV